MQKLAVKHRDLSEADLVIDRGSLDNPLHPMHQHLLDRWTAPADAIETKLSPPVRLVIALGSALMAWAVLIGAGLGIASLI